MGRQKLKDEILEVLKDSKDAPDVAEIMKRLKRQRIWKALKELEAEGKIEYTWLHAGWRLMKEAEG